MSATPILAIALVAAITLWVFQVFHLTGDLMDLRGDNERLRTALKDALDDRPLADVVPIRKDGAS